jgi:diacylglycerol kinase family enzyme
VLINPYGGKKQGVDVYNKHVAPVFDQSGVKTTVKRTQFSGHARNLILDMSSAELASYDGVVAVGGDGLFHEIVNGLLSLRSMAVKRSTTEAGGDTISGLLAQLTTSSNISGSSTLEQNLAAATTTTTNSNNTNNTKDITLEIAKKAAISSNLRVGHIPAGSTDAVACTLNGTRNAFSAAMRIALGDKVPLDVLRIDAADGTTEFATCMASYGFMGDLMSESEALRWIGPLRYELVGAKMLAANRSYRAKISYLPAQATSAGSFSKVCSARCELCFGRTPTSSNSNIGSGGGGSSSGAATFTSGGDPVSTMRPSSRNRNSSPKNSGGYYSNNSLTTDSLLGGGGGSGRTSPTTSINNTNHTHTHTDNHGGAKTTTTTQQSPFARHSRLSLNHRQSDWTTVEDDFAGVMLVIMPCRSDKSTAGVARYGHLSDGNIHLVLVRRCSRLQYLRFLLKLSSTGLEPGKHHGGYIEVIPAVAVRVEPGGSQESQWNIDGELLNCAAITAETHRGAIEVFARGVEE